MYYNLKLRERRRLGLFGEGAREVGVAVEVGEVLLVTEPKAVPTLTFRKYTQIVIIFENTMITQAYWGQEGRPRNQRGDEGNMGIKGGTTAWPSKCCTSSDAWR